ncbi:bifunctional adenosylcobinamide kinase/adenosylcobinamide-phosphate guanylyltransferase [Halomonas sp. CUBES01]|uniref:bifunctional adenosylcobinamide kinase/adenosylcobinamide-phosphate guanylyltransferase n=1 Tax=Halomonas sp. CUBES01 TaxID=2897340 RepID=UPI001E34DDCF|nr:bifunctional adenosylcobinamide kinase/adenosylcobinamide-phosphate guanylyltransferase [Halomonas sp. CUBES01]MEC4767643.1 bifunctional adenosylcobinamide kinase/adenosylcobinamide-phosphate guanylyltransferase [Halomonas sp. CUBES01]
MQLFIGGARAGKHDAVAARFPQATWWRLTPGQRLISAADGLAEGTPLVVHSVFDWLAASVDPLQDDDETRRQWQDDLKCLRHAAQTNDAALVMIVNEIGRGIVPMDREARRLRDLNGWFCQDAAAQSDQAWYVRHGLVMAIK